MPAITRAVIITAVLAVAANITSAQTPTTADGQSSWELSAFGGIMTGDTFFNATVNGLRAEAETDTGWLTGARLGLEGENFGLETSIAGVFTDMNVEADPAAMLDSGDNASMLLVDFNGLWFPGGNEFSDGRTRFYVTGGPGLLHIMSDFDQTDGETMLDLNAGAGIKFLLGDQGNPVLRFDYRWHHFMETGDLEDVNCQEISVGLGLRF